MVIAVIAAGGKGKRTGIKGGKQFYDLKGKPVVARTVEKFLEVNEVDLILVALESENLERFEKVKEEFFSGENRVVSRDLAGGERFETVFNSICFLEENLKDHFSEAVVLVHDGARPFLSADLIRSVIAGAELYGACVPAVELPDTVKEVEDHFVVRTLDRRVLRAVQTPQGFKAKILLDAYRKAFHENADPGKFTDDASVLEWYGSRIYTVPGERFNLKITYPEDLKLAEQILELDGA
jgi:2-C-methyl-D-erythritol 4-phosphate cytidylyltransferase